MGDVLLGALALMFIFEGLLPFLSPQAWRDLFARALRLTDGQLRFLGLSSILLGLVLITFFVS